MDFVRRGGDDLEEEVNAILPIANCNTEGHNVTDTCIGRVTDVTDTCVTVARSEVLCDQIWRDMAGYGRYRGYKRDTVQISSDIAKIRVRPGL